MDKVTTKDGHLAIKDLSLSGKPSDFHLMRKVWRRHFWAYLPIRIVAHRIRAGGGELPFDVALTPILAPEPVWMYFSEQAGTPLFHEIWARNEYIKDRKVKAMASRKKVDLFLKFYGYRRQ